MDVLNSHVGISTILPPAEESHLPSTERFAGIGNSADISEIAAYKHDIAPNGFARTVAEAFCPTVPSDEILKPAIFAQTLESLESKLQAETSHPEVRRFLREDLLPLKENRLLLNAYLGLMVEG